MASVLTDTNDNGGNAMTEHQVVTHDQWHAARPDLRERERGRHDEHADAL
jgi:hypothetical protein